MGPKKNWGPKFLLGGRKSYLAAEHHNEAAPKKKKKPGFFRLGAEKYDFRAPKEQRPIERTEGSFPGYRRGTMGKNIVS